MYTCFGITERGDASLDTRWVNYIKDFPILLITKNPQKLYTILKTIPINNLKHIVVHCTITGLNNTNIIFEPNVPSYENSFEWLQNISNLLGDVNKNRVVLRIDPIIPDKDIFDRSARLMLNKAKNYSSIKRIRISFIDNYSYLEERDMHLPWSTFHAPLEKRLYYYNFIKEFCNDNSFELEVCGEPNIPCIGCISEKDIKAVGLSLSDFYFSETGNKQRKYCKCLSIKHELLSNKHPCKHKCIYCYWKN